MEMSDAIRSIADGSTYREECDCDTCETLRVIDEVGSVTLPAEAKRVWSTGANRDSAAGKGRFDLLPLEMLMRDAKHYEKGASKYGPHNWRKGIPLSSYLDSAFRHLTQLARGDTDEDHAAAVRFNVAGFAWTLEQIQAGLLPQELDDRYKGGAK